MAPVGETQLLLRAVAGAIFLDQYDIGWAKRLTKPVRVANTRECLLAQLYGRFKTGLNELGLSMDDALAFGFRVEPREFGEVAGLSQHELAKKLYKALDDVWHELVRHRL
jgi:hypothetical protein